MAWSTWTPPFMNRQDTILRSGGHSNGCCITCTLTPHILQKNGCGPLCCLYTAKLTSKFMPTLVASGNCTPSIQTCECLGRLWLHPTIRTQASCNDIEAELTRQGGRLPERLIVRERVWFACKKLKGYSVSTKWELLLLGTSPRVSTWRNHTWSNLPDLPLCIGNRLWMGSSALAVGECRTEGDLYILLHSATAKIYLKLGDVHAHH